MSGDFSKVLELLPRLSQQEREQVRLHIVLLDGTAIKKKSVDADDWLLLGMSRELHRRGVWTSRAVVPARFLPKDFGEKSEKMRKFLLQGLGPHISRTELVAFGGVVAEVLFDYLKIIKVPLTKRTAFTCFEEIPEALECAFPGYWRFGLMTLLVQRSGGTIG